MKKFTITLLYALIFLSANFTDIRTDAYTRNLNFNEEKLVEIESGTNIIEENIDELEKEEQILLAKQAEEKQAEESNNAISEEYVDSNVQYTETYGTYGRLYVSWYNAALYDYNVYTGSSSSLQELVDNYDSAAFYTSYGRLVIADHDTQGFSVLTGLSEGSTAYIKFADGSTIGYRLIQKSKGYNTGPDLVDTAGNSFYNMDSDLIMYTCYDGGIMVTLWVLA